jgi:hypothetical protein
MKKLSMLVLLVLCIALAAGSALADRTVKVTPIDDLHLQNLGVTGRQDCIIGNIHDPAWILSGWFTGAEGYKYKSNPYNQNCICPVGFSVEAVHMLLNFPDDGVYPVVFTAYVDLEEGVLVGDCWTPGPEICTGDVYTITIDAAGNYDLSLPITCPCAGMNYFYFVSFHFIDLFYANIISDDVPRQCAAYNDWGSGWQDLWGYGFEQYGMPIIYAETACCQPAVEEDGSTWGAMKNLYK